MVAYEPVGLPMFAVQLDVIVQRKKPIAPIDEFALRAVAEGVASLEHVSGFLGLEVRLAEEAVLNQLQAATITSQPDDSGARKLGLTTRGVQTLSDLAGYVPERMEITVIYDRMIRKVSGTEDRGMIKPPGLEHRSLRARPPVRPPTVREISADDVNVALAKSEGIQRVRRRAEAEFQLMGIKRVIRADRRYTPATLLVFRSPKTAKLEAGVIVNGRPSTPHTQAMAELGGLAFLEIDESSITARRGYRDALKAAAVADSSVVHGDEVDEAMTTFLAARRRLHDPDLEVEEGDRTGIASRDAAEAAYRAAGARLLAWPARRVLAWEHPILLEWALRTARERVLVSSPVVTDQSAGYDVAQMVEAAAARGVSVTFVLPARGSKMTRGEDDARRRLQDLAARRPRFAVIESPTASPALFWDDFWVSGSFPWLGHEGLGEGSLIAAESIVVRDPMRAEHAFLDLNRR